MGHGEGSPEREVHSYTGLPIKETFQVNNLTLCLQELKKQQQRQPRARRRKEITKIRGEFKKKKKKTRVKHQCKGSIKPGACSLKR